MIKVRAYTEADAAAMAAIWNEVVEAGDAFPQEETLGTGQGTEGAAEFFAGQTHCGVALDEDGNVAGMYILHPNNVGRCGHIANASYAVSSKCRGKHIGEALVKDCMAQAKQHGYRVLQFNAVVATNTHARHLYERLGFKQLGTIKGGFRMGGKDEANGAKYVDICPYYINL